MAIEDPFELNLTPDLLNDFYAECDEHLGIVRQALVHLEQEPPGSAAVTTVIQKLFRSFHSLKGIIGMVGITSAEHLAHRTEDYLRELSKESTHLSEEGMDLLARAAHLIEQTVAAFRDQKPLPDVAAALAKFDSIIPAAAGVAPQKEEPKAEPDNPLQAKIDQASRKGLGVWKCTFVPSTALNERGINVNYVRERLAQYGEILQAAPRISGGAMAFEFFLAGAAMPADPGKWQEEGATFEQLKAPAAGVAPAPRPVPVTETAKNLFVGSSHFVRVELERLDDLMRVAGELVIQRARLEEQINRLNAAGEVDTRGLQEVNVGFNRYFRELRETVMRLRMVPIAEIFDRLPFVVRDLTRGTEKKVRLETRGQQTELDKYVVERLKDPLLHLVRNAISHGIEDPAERIAADKPAEATLRLSAATAGETVIVEIADDGRGINRGKVLARAQQIGVEVPELVDDAALLDLICLPGFSTREEADRAAGRGVGMSVVSSTLRELGGNLFLASEPGRGTRFTMRLPLTLLITDALIVTTAGQNYAIPQSSVEEVLHIQEAEVRRIENAELVSVRGAALPLVRLRAIFGFPLSDRKMPSVLIFQAERGRAGLVVDRIIGQRQVVVRSLRDPLIHVPGVIGATELGDGKPLLIIDPLTVSKQHSAARAGAGELRAPALR